MKLICVTGMRGCGKTVFGEIAKSLGFLVYEMSAVVRDMMNAEGIEINNRNMREYAKRIREEFGKDIVAKKIVERINAEKKGDGVIVVTGIRGMYEIREFKEAFGEGNVVLLAIHSPPKMRYERVMKRETKSDDPKSYEEFLWSEEMELGYGMSKAIALADKMIVNDGAIEEYIPKCKEFLEKIKRVRRND